jgi:NCAIR mutase (PurE)-related protein
MDKASLIKLMEEVRSGAIAPDAAADRLRGLPFEDLGFAKVDHHRCLRQGFPETIFAEGKTPEQVVEIIACMRARGSRVLATRCAPDTIEAVLKAYPDAEHHKTARAVTVGKPDAQMDGFIGVLCAGTSDMPVGEEAAVTCEAMSCRVERIYDVGVAGIHRLFHQRDRIEKANALIVCAGMEGALPSVVAGLVDKPVFAVPTSVGYGASFQGLAALLAMLNSCATGVSVVNIDNGYGAGALAAMVNRVANGL